MGIFLTLLQAGLPLAVRLITAYLDKVGASNEQKKAFMGFLETMEVHPGVSVKLKLSYRAQKERLEKIIAERERNSNANQ